MAVIRIAPSQALGGLTHLTEARVSTAGTEHLLGELFLLHRQRLLKLCTGYLRSAADAEDAVQETFSRAAAHIGEVRGEYGAYLATIARNVCVDEIRRRTRLVGPASEELASSEAGPEKTALDRTMVRQLRRTLSARDRLLLTCTFWGLSPSETAERSGATLNATNAGLSRARERARRLRDSYSAWLPFPALSNPVRRLVAMAREAMRRAAGTAAFQPALLTGSMLAILIGGGSLIVALTSVPHAGASVGPASSVSLAGTPAGFARLAVRGSRVGTAEPADASASGSHVLPVDSGEVAAPDGSNQRVQGGCGTTGCQFGIQRAPGVVQPPSTISSQAVTHGENVSTSSAEVSAGVAATGSGGASAEAGFMVLRSPH